MLRNNITNKRDIVGIGTHSGHVVPHKSIRIIIRILSLLECTTIAVEKSKFKSIYNILIDRYYAANARSIENKRCGIRNDDN